MDKLVKALRTIKQLMLEIKLKDKKHNNCIQNKKKVKDAGNHVQRLK